MQLQTFKVITRVTKIPTASSDVDMNLDQIIKSELETKDMRTQAPQGSPIYKSNTQCGNVDPGSNVWIQYGCNGTFAKACALRLAD